MNKEPKCSNCSNCIWSDLVVDAPTHEIYGLECRIHHSYVDIDCDLYEVWRGKCMDSHIVYRNAREDGWDSPYSKPYEPISQKELTDYGYL